jgi:hypothetical protein
MFDHCLAEPHADHQDQKGIAGDDADHMRHRAGEPEIHAGGKQHHIIGSWRQRPGKAEGRRRQCEFEGHVGLPALVKK